MKNLIFQWPILAFLIKFKVTYGLERIVTNITVVNLGVAVDYSFNETSSRTPGGLPSVPGCPRSTEGNPWVYYGTPVRCYLSGERGPCGEEQTLLIHKNNPVGYCMCDCLGNASFGKPDEVCPSEMVHYKKFVFVARLNSCFPLYEQGPCKSKQEWLAIVNGSAVCAKRRCPDVPLTWSNGEIRSYNGKIGCRGKFYVRRDRVTTAMLKTDCADNGMKYCEELGKCIKPIKLF